ncbi:MAG: DUF4091 domain-containing protein [Bacteroidales bacterium]|nr:DUF4091 domain-containing protein [Bacteroidales bacterium]
MKRSIFISVCLFFFLFFSTCKTEIEPLSIGFPEPDDPNPVPVETWNEITPGLHGSFGSIDERYNRSTPSKISISKTWEGTAWRGERTNAQLVLWTSENIQNVKITSTRLEGIEGHKIDSSSVNIQLVRYVLTDEFLTGCGHRSPDTIPSYLVADPLENTASFNLLANTTRPVWISINVPANTAPDQYKGTILITTSEETKLEFEINLEVQDWVLPPPSEWAFHLDLWQNPFAVARYHNVEPWSQEHLDLLKPLLTMLAEAGQKCITTSIVHKPWGGQTYDFFESMINWIKNSGGGWDYDYSVFNQYVKFAHDCGITEQINCYSMVPWGNNFRYFDEDSAGYVTIQAKPGSEDYEELWKPFLYDFRAHLKEMGWLNKTTIAMDERGLEDMKKMISLLKEATPEIKITLAGEYHPEIKFDVYDLCVFIRPPLETDPISERVEKGFPTTFYTSCARPEHPNNFTFSPPAEAAWIGWHAAAQGYSGFLRWAYNSWVKDPLMDSRFRTWPAGDTYQVYPGPRSSIRFERLRGGIQDYEKIRILRKEFLQADSENGKANLKKLNDLLQSFTLEGLQNKPAEKWVNEGKKILNKLSE